MKRLLLSSILVAVFLSQAVYAGDKNDVESKINAKVSALSDAMVDADAEALMKLTSPNLVYGHSSGRVEDQKTFVENILNGNSNFLTIELEDQTIKVTEDVAVVRHVLAANVHDKGKEPADIRIGIMLVWHKEKGDWLLLARQAYKLPQ